jgi:predicted secreted protein
MNARHLTLTVGEQHEIRLPGLSTAGYRWSCDVEGDREAVEVTEAWEGHSEDRGAVGTSTEETFTITARRPGSARLLFEQRRRWEADPSPANTLAVRVDVEP